MHRDFGEALPLHVDGEDRSIAPSLEAAGGALVHRLAREYDEIVAAIATLARDGCALPRVKRPSAPSGPTGVRVRRIVEDGKALAT